MVPLPTGSNNLTPLSRCIQIPSLSLVSRRQPALQGGGRRKSGRPISAMPRSPPVPMFIRVLSKLRSKVVSYPKPFLVSTETVVQCFFTVVGCSEFTVLLDSAHTSSGTSHCYSQVRLVCCLLEKSLPGVRSAVAPQCSLL